MSLSTVMADSSIVFFDLTGNYYQTIDATEIAWETANTAANALSYNNCPGHLVTITSAQENQFLIDSFTTDTLSAKWLGASQSSSATEVDAGWTWVTGEPFSYTDWAQSPLEPNDSPGLYVEDGQEQYLEWRHDGAGWNDEDNGTDTLYPNTGYVVEYECPLLVNTGGPYQGPEGASIQLNGVFLGQSGDYVSYEWTFGDGMGGCPSLSCAYSAPDGPTSTTARLLACDFDDWDHDNFTTSTADDCTVAITTINVLNVAPTVSISPDGIQVHHNEPIDFIGSYTDPAGPLDEPYTILWNFGDGNTSSELNPQHTYPNDGTYSVSLCVTDKDGGQGCATASIEVINQPPDCDAATPSIAQIWSPNHQMLAVNIMITDPDGDPVVVTITAITHNEDENGLGDGNTSPDEGGIGTATAEVRAERSGLGDGRTYTIEFAATDNLPNGDCTGEVTVFVPHDMSGNNATSNNTIVDTSVVAPSPSSNSNKNNANSNHGNSNSNGNGNSNGHAGANNNGNNGNGNANSNTKQHGNSNGNGNGKNGNQLLRTILSHKTNIF